MQKRVLAPWSTAALAGAVLAMMMLAGCSTAVRELQPGPDGRYVVHLTSDNRFSPNLGQLPVGANVTFVSEGFHDVDVEGPVSGTSGPPGELTAGKSWSFVFSQPGTYELKCHLHSGVGMTAKFTVVVPEGAATATDDAAGSTAAA